MAWSSYAHLPNGEEEYRKILSELNNEMSVSEVDEVIAKVKGKGHVSHHYRSNLARIGLFDVRDEKVYLNYDVSMLKREKPYLKKILSESLLRCKKMEIDIVKSIVWKNKTYDLKKVVELLKNEYPELEKNNIVRWIRPVVNLLTIMDCLGLSKAEERRGKGEGLREGRLDADGPEVDKCKCFLQQSYLNLAKEFGKVTALEEIEKELKRIEESYDIVDFLEKLLLDGKEKFKIELLMMPTWATKNEAYKISGDYYTHLRIKSDLL